MKKYIFAITFCTGSWIERSAVGENEDQAKAIVWCTLEDQYKDNAESIELVDVEEA